LANTITNKKPGSHKTGRCRGDHITVNDFHHTSRIAESAQVSNKIDEPKKVEQRRFFFRIGMHTRNGVINLY